MEGVNRLNTDTVDPLTQKTLASLIDWRLIPSLSGKHPLGLSFGSSTVWYYEKNHQIVGVLIANTLSKHPVAELEWLFVTQNFRNHGIATQLLNAALEFLKNCGVAALTFRYATGGVDTLAIEKLLTHYHIAFTRPILRRYRFNVAEFNPSWLTKTVPLPSHLSFFPWKELTAKEAKQLEHRFDQFQIPASLSPFHHPELIHHESSIGVRSPDGVVGWGVCHKIQQDEVEYSSVYVDKNLAPVSLGFSILSHTIRLIKEQDSPKYVWMIIRLHDDPLPSWSNFINKRLSCWADQILEIHQATYTG